MASISSSEQQPTPNSTLTDTKLTKLTAILLIMYYFQLLSYWDAVQMVIAIQFQTLYNETDMLTKSYSKEDKRKKGITEAVYSSTYSIQFINWTDNSGI